MVIGKSQLNMEASRNYSAKSKAIVASATSVESNAIKSYSEITHSMAERKTIGYSDSEDIKEKNEKSNKLDGESNGNLGESGLAKGFNLNRRRLPSISKPTNEIERRNAKKIREQALLYLLLRLKRILEGDSKKAEDGTNSLNDIYSDYSSPNDNGNVTHANTSYNGILPDVNRNNSFANVIGYRYSEYSYEEYENTNFNTTGTVVTADGRELNFGVSLSMTRRFAEAVSNVTEIVGNVSANLIDPLVINLDNNPASVSDQKFLFDLDCDGEKENIANLKSGSGFLAFDKNNDGIINDGSELFGTKSGNGFSDLAKYDSDNNGWIDEADEIFSKLLIWTKDEDGNDKLYKLKDLNVGAICLENVNTDFSLRDEGNITQGIIRHTGLFLYEDGRAGTMQHLDLAT